MGRDGRFTLIATILGSSMAFIDTTVVNVALPTIQRDLAAAAIPIADTHIGIAYV